MLAFPYMVLQAAAGQRLYSGALFHPNDVFFYFSVLLQGNRGAWLFTNNFTFQQQPALPLHWFYLLLGKLDPWTGGPLADLILWQFSRLLVGGLFLWQDWLLFGEALSRESRRVAFLFLLFSSGLAVYEVLLAPAAVRSSLPFDLAYSESSSFFELLYAPHFAAVLLLLVVFLREVRFALVDGSRSAALKAAAAAGFVSLIHPDKSTVLVITLVLFTTWTSWRAGGSIPRWLLAGMMVAPALPYPIYLLWLTRHSLPFQTFLAQDPFIPPGALAYVLGYGIPGLCALTGLPRLWRAQAGPGEALLWSFVLAGIVLALLPLTMIPRKSVEGVQLAIAGLAGRQLVHDILPRLWRGGAFDRVAHLRPLGYSRRRLRLLSINLVLILSSPTVLALAFASPRAGLADSQELFLTRDDSAAVSWLQHNADGGDVLLGGEETGQFAAAYGGTHVVFGHFQWTPQVGAEHLQLVHFLGQNRDGVCDPATRSFDRVAYLRSRSVRWLYWGPRESRCNALDPSSMNCLALRFEHETTTIYAVEPQRLAACVRGRS